MLSNAYFLAKFRFDTAENEPAKNLQNLLIFPILLTLTPNSPRCEGAGGVAGARARRRGLRVELLRRPAERLHTLSYFQTYPWHGYFGPGSPGTVKFSPNGSREALQNACLQTSASMQPRTSPHMSLQTREGS